MSLTSKISQMSISRETQGLQKIGRNNFLFASFTDKSMSFTDVAASYTDNSKSYTDGSTSCTDNFTSYTDNFASYTENIVLIKYKSTNNMVRGDWMPASGEAVLRMAGTWITYIPAIDDRFTLPKETMETFELKTSEFGTLFLTPLASRTPAINAQIRAARKELEALMRDIKRRHLFSPPLTDADIISLGLKPRNNTKTSVGDPVGLVSATVKYPNEGALEINIKHVAGTPFDKRANYGVKIRSTVLPIDHPSPNDVRMLTDSRFTRRKRELFIFDKSDRKKVAYFCFRYENAKGRTGQWSSIMSAIIP